MRQAVRRAKHLPLAVFVQARPFSVPAQTRSPSTATLNTRLSGRPLAVVKFCQRYRGMSGGAASRPAATSAGVHTDAGVS